MMFSSDDLKYIETEILYIVGDKACSYHQLSEASHTGQLEVNETKTDCHGLTKDISPQEISIYQRLENLWKIHPSVVHPKDLERL
ncbi:MAG: hypothetical protein AAF579_09625 [Cyanobacteria bacterium P01_C01_bin.118]